MKQAKMVVDKAFSSFQKSTKEFMVPLLNIWEELYTMEFISRDIHLSRCGWFSHRCY